MPKAVGKPYEFPDPNDRSPNENAVIIKAPQILGLYNQAHPDDQMSRVVDSVKEWFTTEAINRKWDSVEFVGSECMLKNTRILRYKK